jgi:hypothetical protein
MPGVSATEVNFIKLGSGGEWESSAGAPPCCPPEEVSVGLNHDRMQRRSGV